MRSYLLFCIFFIGLAGNAWADLNDGLIAYYPFNGNANDESGNSFNGTVQGATLISDRFGNGNSAYEFDGIDDYIDFGEVELNVGTNFCFSTWIKAYEEDRDDHRVVLSKGPKHSGHFEIYLDVVYPGTIAGEFRFNPHDEIYGSGISVDDGSFHHLVVNCKNDIINFYVDGVLSSTETFSVVIPDEKEIFFIGRQTDNYYYPEYSPMYFPGIIDDVRIYNRDLSEDEIQELYTMANDNSACDEEDLDEAYNQGYDDGYAAGYSEGSGSTDRVTICHVNRNKSITITVSSDALAAHLRHGDTLGACE